MKKKWKIGILIILEILCFLYLWHGLRTKSEQCEPLQTDLSLWQSNYSFYSDGEWYIDSSMVYSSETVDFIYGPYMELPKGDYTLQIWYECSKSQSVLPFASEGNKYHLKTGSNILSRAKDYGEFRFRAKEDIDNFEVVVRFNGDGYLTVKDIRIVPNTCQETRNLFLYVMGVLLLDLFLLFAKYLKKIQKECILLCLITFLACLPLFVEGMHKGHDFRFHVMRVEGIISSLAEHRFPVRMSSAWLDGYGYPAAIYYGDQFLWIPAVLYRLGFSLIGSFKAFVFLIQAATTVITYICCRRIYREKSSAMLVTFVYVTATYRMADVYVRSAVGEYVAMMFFPIVALAVYQSFCTDKSWKENAGLLAIGMTGIFCNHILSTEMMAVVLVIVTLVYLDAMIWRLEAQAKDPDEVKKNRKEILYRIKNLALTYIVAAVQTILFSLWFLVPFFDYYKNEMVDINDTVAGEYASKIQNAGAYITQFFAFFQSSFGLGNPGTAMDERMGMTPGAVLMLVLAAACVLWYQKKADAKVKWLTVISILLLFVSSNLFPWNHIAANSKLGNMLAQIQFPWRYLAFACLFLSLMAGFLLEQNTWVRKKSNLIVIVGVIATFLFVGDYCDNADIVKYYDTAELTSHSIGSGEYLRIDYDEDGDVIEANTSWLDGQWMTDDGILEFEIIDDQGLNKVFYVKSGPNGGSVEIPVFHYRGYQVTDGNGREYELSDGDNFNIHVEIGPDFEGDLTLDYKEPQSWKQAEVASVISIVVIALLYLCRYLAGIRRERAKCNKCE